MPGRTQAVYYRDNAGREPVNAFLEDLARPARDRELAIKRFTDFKARMGAEPRRPPRAAGRDAPPRSRGR